MGTTAEKLNRLAQTKNGIKAALASKGVAVAEGTPFRDYAALIDSLCSLTAAEITEIENELAELLQETDLGWIETLGGYSIAAKIRFLQLCRGRILNAILKKGVEIPDSQPFRTIGELIEQIKTEFATQEKTVIPTTQDQTVTPDSGYDGLSSVTVSGDANLVPENIKKDVSIFGVIGTSETSEGSDAGSGTITTNRVSAVSLSESDNSFTITLENGSIILGSASFDSDGNPTGLTDASGNTVEFSNGYPTSATDIMGNTVPISWG